ncbi:response regulator [Clostridium fungisolvens]|uniref:Stage 0 sporulation protein A homolog n=1 Tax=Clostridium fungisolvens TaxID=1604897 RepID=A0A6V8SM66_9CLOT|nr:response regulator [Clostridium fungisolvens]GFP77632.1 Transcriptional regulatory protein ZraR [Clostridium fungisolvens]
MKNKSLLMASQDDKMTAGRILIVDDDVTLTSIMVSRYKNRNYSVAVADNANAALVLMKYALFNLLIIDFYMDTMYADEFIKKVKRIDNNINIIVLSAQKSTENAKYLLKIGASEIVKKPFSPKEMDEIIKKYIKE